MSTWHSAPSGYATARATAHGRSASTSRPPPCSRGGSIAAASCDPPRSKVYGGQEISYHKFIDKGKRVVVDQCTSSLSIRDPAGRYYQWRAVGVWEADRVTDSEPCSVDADRLAWTWRLPPAG